MDRHQNARLTPRGREELGTAVIKEALSAQNSRQVGAALLDEITGSAFGSLGRFCSCFLAFWAHPPERLRVEWPLVGKRSDVRFQFRLRVLWAALVFGHPIILRYLQARPCWFRYDRPAPEKLSQVESESPGSKGDAR